MQLALPELPNNCSGLLVYLPLGLLVGFSQTGQVGGKQVQSLVPHVVFLGHHLDAVEGHVELLHLAAELPAHIDRSRLCI